MGTPSPSLIPPGPLPADFPIVGLGASAGGLEALERFLGQVPAGSDMAFVVVQHLDPTREGLLVELLQRVTAMPVLRVVDRIRVRPGHVYVIPPGRDLALMRGRLHLLDPEERRGLRLPIDFFFRSLAQDQGARAIGAVLSGMGSDGTEGLRAIKSAGGLAFVQDPVSAKFDGMPRSVLDAGLTDAMAAPEDLPGRIAAALWPAAVRGAGDAPAPDRDALEKVVLLLRARTGHDFSMYKKPTIHRRIERRMGLQQISRPQDYVRYLRDNPGEVDRLFQELLIGVTQFFRDPEAWGCLRDEILPALFAAHPQGAAFRAWTAGCSTGEEAYSLAMVFREALDRLPTAGEYTLLIFATDLDKRAIDRARRGLFAPDIARDVSAARLERFFLREDTGYRVVKAIRDMVIFAPQNLAMDPPFTKLDLLICRNLLIYLDPALQTKLQPLFHYSLKPGGILFLGSAEAIGGATELFAPLERKHRIYRRVDRGAKLEMLDLPFRFAHRRLEAPLDCPTPPKGPSPGANLEVQVAQFLLQRYVPSAILVDAQGNLLFTTGRTGKYLEPPVGTASLNLFAMAREGLGNLLNEAFHRAVREQAPVLLRRVKVAGEGGDLLVDITVEPMTEPEIMRGRVMVLFTDVTLPLDALEPPDPAAERPGEQAQAQQLQEARAELHATQAELHTTRQDMQTSREELRSANEELQSINEELQSTNEELTTSKEEMQSMNEELQTVNLELQAKVDELSLVNNDLKNLFNSTDIATLFLDEALCIRRFTTQAANLIRLLPGDLGRPITDITTVLLYPELAQDARTVLATLVFKERAVQTQDGRWFQVRIMPYRTAENRIDGVVMTFADMTAAHGLEATVRTLEAENADLRARLRPDGPAEGPGR